MYKWARLLTSQSTGKKLRISPRLKWTFWTLFALSGSYYAWTYLKRAMRPSFTGRKKKIVILGSGWGALSVINNLNPGQFDVTVVSPRNYFLFTPLLPSVTVGTVEARSIVEPIRKLIQKVHGRIDSGVEFLESECVDIDPATKSVRCEDRSGVVGAVSKVDVSGVLFVAYIHHTVDTFNRPFPRMRGNLKGKGGSWTPYSTADSGRSVAVGVKYALHKKAELIT